jgi:hypothetical protein
MSDLLNKPITWRSLVRIGLAFAAEYAMLALIEDAPVALKVATVFCATATLAALEADSWVRRQGKYVFPLVMGCLGIVYLGFVVYALAETYQQRHVKSQLKMLYSESTPLTTLPINSVSDIHQFKTAYLEWEQKSSAWILAHIGPTSRDLFLSRPEPTSFGGQAPQSTQQLLLWNECGDAEYLCFRRRLEMDRRSLTTLIESNSYGG